MRLVLKLALLLAIGVVMQVAMQSYAVVQQFPLDFTGGRFDDQVAHSYDTARADFERSNGLTRWVICTVWFNPGPSM